MKMWKLVVVLVLIAVAIYAVPRLGKSTTIERNGNQVSMTIGNHHLTASATSNEITDSFLVVGGFSGGDRYFTTLLSVIPMKTAERLHRQYGNFRKCCSPGAAEGMRSIIPVKLYADNYTVEQTLKTANKLANDHKDPVIKMTFVQLNITDHQMKYNGEVVPVTSQDNSDAFLVKDIQIVEKEHKF